MHRSFANAAIDIDADTRALIDAFDEEIAAWQMSPSTRGFDVAAAQLAFWTESLANVRLEGEEGRAEDVFLSRYGSEGEGPRAALNSANALAYALGALLPERPGAPETSSAEFVHDLHTIVMHRLLPEERLGVWRETEVDVIDTRDPRRLKPTCPAAEIREAMDEWSRAFARNAWRGRHPLLRSGLAHLDFVAKHPYPDGNGRVGRVLVNAMHVEAGLPALPISRIFETSRRSYHLAIGAAEDANSAGPYLAYHAEAGFHAARHLRELARGLDKIVRATGAAFEKAGLERREARALALAVAGFPVASATTLAERSFLRDEKKVERAMTALADAGAAERLSGAQFGGRLGAGPLWRAREPLALLVKPYRYQVRQSRSLSAEDGEPER